MNLEQYPGQHQWNKMQEVVGNEDIKAKLLLPKHWEAQFEANK